MGIEDIQISEELETNAPSIKYRGNEGPKSPQEIQEMMMASAPDPMDERNSMMETIAMEEFGKPLSDLNEDEIIQIELFMEEMDTYGSSSIMDKYKRYIQEMINTGNKPLDFEEFKKMIEESEKTIAKPLPNDPTKPVNPFAPKPTGPTLPDRQMAAYGGIMGLDGRKKYGIGSWFQENIMDPIKENPEVALAAAAAGVDYFGIPDYDILGPIGGLGGEKILTGGNTISKLLAKKPGGDDADDDAKSYGEMITGAIGKNIIPIVGGLASGLFTNNQQGGGQDMSGVPSDNTAIQLANLKKSANLLDQKQGLQAGLNFLPTVASRKYSPAEMAITYQNAANGGRIGFNMGGGADMGSPQMTAAQATEEAITKIMQKMQDPNLTDEDRIFLQEKLKVFMPTQQIDPRMMAMGGRINRAEGGIMDLGGMEKDYRAEGGFVPIGREEKADDVPARLSVNEFVFTADAVRSAGGGDIDQGAKVMENMMKHLEAGGQVSEESQGLGGAREMFETSERLSEVI